VNDRSSRGPDRPRHQPHPRGEDPRGTAVGARDSPRSARPAPWDRGDPAWL